ncbi:selenocysteine insertion sequence-binding protein 2 isoform X2 [Apodemus sylvaticus]|uniref:selenocysteine insertion sequence-binding protein 2 isoform X2 n=1 Tax=Apodemus sylvaticus TaxID=10129 RepID=UPI002244A1C1|nr:selenocysteine insertion sequence-binding protein 2 isoform X2 [Apodemus sylvaticus]
MASERPREPEGEDSIKLSADVKPFVPKFAGLNVAWSESSEACVFPGCAPTYYPFVQESPATEQKMYPEDMAFGAPTFPAQYVSSEIALHPFAYPTYALESAQSVCSMPTLQYDYNQAQCHPGFRTAKPRNEQEAKGVFKMVITSDLTGSPESLPKVHLPLSLDLSLAGWTFLNCRVQRTVMCQRHRSRPGGGRLAPQPVTCLSWEKSASPSQTWRSESMCGQTSPHTTLTHLTIYHLCLPLMGKLVKTNHTDGPVTSNAATSSPSCTRELSWTPMGYIVRQTVSSDSAAATENVTSMINLKKTTSADAKGVSVTSEALSSDPSYNRERRVHPTAKAKASQGGELEQNESSKKNKKKKEKSKSSYEVLMAQEPPRIEDAEEFPNLSVASERRHRGESPKLPSTQQPQNDFKTSGKKSQIPVQLDLGGMLAALEKQQHAPHTKPSSRPVVFSVGAVPVLSKDASSGERGRRSSQVKTPHNPLDSSAPLMKKGKQRETPKAKKPTSLKKIILKERQERMQQRLQESAASLTVASDDTQDVESGASNQTPSQDNPTGPEKIEESVSTPVVEGESEEPAGTEFQRDPEACQPSPDSATFPKIHSRRFRDYCSQMLSKEVDACVTGLLKELVRFQDRMYQKDPVKAKTKRRLVLGLREVLKHLKLRKLKCIIISPNCEKTQSKGGLDDTLHTIIDCACEQNVPFVFALNRKALGRSLNKAVPVSIVGIFSYDGAQDQFHKMVELTMAARQAYKTMLETVRQEQAGEPGPQMPPSPPMQDPIQSTEESTPASTGEEPHYIEIWRKHLEAYSQRALELEDSLEASTSQMMNLNL